MKKLMGRKGTLASAHMKYIAVTKIETQETLISTALNMTMFSMICYISSRIVGLEGAGPTSYLMAGFLVGAAALTGWREFYEMALAFKASKQHLSLYRADVKMPRQTTDGSTVLNYTRMLYAPIGAKKIAHEVDVAMREAGKCNLDIAEIADLKWKRMGFGGSNEEVQASVWFFA